MIVARGESNWEMASRKLVEPSNKTSQAESMYSTYIAKSHSDTERKNSNRFTIYLIICEECFKFQFEQGSKTIQYTIH
jgi:hypothetical protein